MTLALRMTIAVFGLYLLASPVAAGLDVTPLGRIKGVSDKQDARATPEKWKAVRRLLGDDADRVAIRQTACNLRGNTSVRSEMPLKWKDKGYYRRHRDLGQVITAERDMTLDAIVLRTGNDDLAYLDGTPGAKVLLQFFEVRGTPRINDNGTPPGTPPEHGWSKTAHRCDDYLEGVIHEPIRTARGGVMPTLPEGDDGKRLYLKWDLTGEDEIRLQKGKRYAFMVGFEAPGPRRNFTLSNMNWTHLKDPPSLEGTRYDGGWGLRREGNGENPPRKIPGKKPPDDDAVREKLRRQSTFPPLKERLAIPPTTEGHPDVDTYRDFEFYVIAKE